MTPLAHAITKELLLPPNKRRIDDQCSLLQHMGGIHCFEVSEVWPLVTEMIASGKLDTTEDETRFQEMAGETSFLSAPKTWLEWRWNDMRHAVLLSENGARAEMRQAAGRGGRAVTLAHVVQIGLGARGGDALEMVAPKDMGEEDISEWSALVAKLHVALALINTPRVIGRRQHMPHRGLERSLLASRKTVGEFTLQPWTEIKLEVERPSEDVGGDPMGEAHLTGQKALHFCRSHLRVRLGQVEIVRAHWRGDAALGIRQSTYTVVPPT